MSDTKKGNLKRIHPVLPVKDVDVSIDFYVNKLGFILSFIDSKSSPRYAGVVRDSIEIHLQWHDSEEWENRVERPMLRILTKNIDVLYEEYRKNKVFHENTNLRKTSWGTEEFAFYDPNKNGLTFYRDI